MAPITDTFESQHLYLPEKVVTSDAIFGWLYWTVESQPLYLPEKVVTRKEVNMKQFTG